MKYLKWLGILVAIFVVAFVIAKATEAQPLITAEELDTVDVGVQKNKLGFTGFIDFGDDETWMYVEPKYDYRLFGDPKLLGAALWFETGISFDGDLGAESDAWLFGVNENALFYFFDQPAWKPFLYGGVGYDFALGFIGDGSFTGAIGAGFDYSIGDGAVIRVQYETVKWCGDNFKFTEWENCSNGKGTVTFGILALY